MKFKLFILALFSAISVFAFDFSKTEFLSIPEGNVYQIKTGGEWIYPTNKIPYVTNGLVAYWDGIWNAGLGIHDNEATVWKDLIGTRDFSLYGDQYWTTNAWVVNAWRSRGSENPTYASYSVDERLPANQTIEVVIYPTKTGSSVARITSETGGSGAQYLAPNLMITGSSSNSLVLYRYSSSVWIQNISGYNAYFPHVHTVTHESGSTTVNYYIDGELKHTFTGATVDCTNKTMSLANYIGSGSSQYNRGLDGSYYAMRIYDRVLSDEEIKYNSAIDALRFENRDLCYDTEIYGSVSNSYKKVKVNETILWSVIPYVNEGLVDWWDAKWNVGIGQHDNEANKWKDLVGTRDAALFTNYYWTDNSWVVQSVSNNGLAAMTGGEFPKSQTWQIVLHPTNYKYGGRLLAGLIQPRIVATNNVSFYSSYGINSGTIKIDNFNTFQLHQHTITHAEDSPIVKYWVDGKCVYTNNSATANSDTSQYIYFANRSQKDVGIDAEYHTVRLYDRVLTDDEIFKNTRVDVKRYGIPQYWCEFSFLDGSTVITNLTSMDTRYRENLDLVDVRLGTDCKAISSYAFLDCKNLTNIVMPNINRIYYLTFRYCTNLTSVVIPESCTKIDYSAFYGCDGLTNVVLPDTLTQLGTISRTEANIGPFQYCISLPEIRLPNSLTTLGRKTFRNCTNLKEVTNGEHLETIGYEAFSYCTNLTEFTFGPNIATLETNVFLNSGIQTIKYYKKDTETNEEANSRIKMLVEGTGLDITDKEFICMNYDYSSGAWSHIDMTDVNTLFTDNGMTTKAEIGDPVARIKDKANINNVWIADAVRLRRTEYGVKSTNIINNGYGANVQIYQTNIMFDVDTDWNNNEFTMALVWDKDSFPADVSSTSITRILQPYSSYYKLFRLSYRSSGINTISMMLYGSTNVLNNFVRQDYTNEPVLLIVKAKSENGNISATISLNGIKEEISNVVQSTEIAGMKLIPGICNVVNTGGSLPADHCEMLWWDHIPEDIDNIEKALMEKYNIEPFIIE